MAYCEKYPYINTFHIISDSQYVVGLVGRKEKLTARNFTTKKGIPRRNTDLIKQLLTYAERVHIKFIKVKAHQKETPENKYNREADQLSRKLMRQAVEEFNDTDSTSEE
jgi:ribonuclease HI